MAPRISSRTADSVGVPRYPSALETQTPHGSGTPSAPTRGRLIDPRLRGLPIRSGRASTVDVDSASSAPVDARLRHVPPVPETRHRARHSAAHRPPLAAQRPPQHQMPGMSQPAQMRSPMRSANSSDTYQLLSSPGRSHASVPGIVGVVADPEAFNDPYLGPTANEWTAQPFIRGSDGRVRRYPASGGASANYTQQVKAGTIYDGMPGQVTQRHAGFELSADNRQAAFMVDGFPVSPIKAGEFSVYPLPGGKFMVPQPGFSDCTYACEMMLLLDHGKIDLANANDRPSCTGVRGSTAKVVESLRNRPGVQPLTVQHNIKFGRNWCSGKAVMSGSSKVQMSALARHPWYPAGPVERDGDARGWLDPRSLQSACVSWIGSRPFRRSWMVT